MNQQTWKYTDNFGRPYTIGLAHGPDSGNLVVYCNNNIMVIDFKVNDSKDYNFFIGDELIEINLNKKENAFFYHCNINEAADTPRNRMREASQQEERRVVIGGAVVMGLFILFVLWILMY